MSVRATHQLLYPSRPSRGLSHAASSPWPTPPYKLLSEAPRAFSSRGPCWTCLPLRRAGQGPSLTCSPVRVSVIRAVSSHLSAESALARADLASSCLPARLRTFPTSAPITCPLPRSPVLGSHADVHTLFTHSGQESRACLTGPNSLLPGGCSSSLGFRVCHGGEAASSPGRCLPGLLGGS